MNRRIRSKETSEKSSSDGTAARTRPTSLEEIMLRREKKAAKEVNKAKEEPLNNDKGNSNHLETERTYKSRKDLKDTPKGGTKKEDLKDTPKEGSKKEDLKDTPKKSSKEVRRSMRGDDRSAGKEKGVLNSEKLSSSKSSRDKESKDEKHSEIRTRNGNIARSEYRKEPVKKRHNETTDNDRVKETDEKLRNEGKRKNQGLDNDKRSEIDRPMSKKHDSGRFQDSKYSDRNDHRKEYTKPYHEEPRSKRRRASSRDYDQERHERSVSLSPRAQKRSYHGRDYDNSPPYYSMDKSRRKYPEADRHRTSGNGGYGGGSYRKWGSGLGGYSPRKRKTELKAEQTVKAASPIVRSPEKKTATWDQPPAGGNKTSLVSSFQSTVAKMTSAPVMLTALKQDPATKLETILTGKDAAVDSVQLTQATRPLRRLYIENLPSSATEKMVIDCLNDFLLSSGVNCIQGTKPCLSCMINKEKCQALVEFLTPEHATAALSFDGRSFSGSVLKIRRPKDYIETANVAPEKPVEEIKVISDIVKDSPHKIFIAGISGVISCEMLMEIVSAFGPLAAYRFLYNEELGGPCAFLEYVDHSITSKACAGLNGMKLGRCILTAVHGFPDASEEIFQVSIEASPFYGIPSHAKPLLADPMKVLQLKNVFDREEFLLLSKPELEEILEDIRLECARFGAVKSINVVEYPAGSDSTTDGTVDEPKDGSVKIEAVAEDSILKQSEDVSDLSDTREPQDIADIPEDRTNSDQVLAEDQDKKELAVSPPNGAAFRKPHLPASSVDQHTDLDDVGTTADLPALDQGLVSEALRREDTLVGADHDISAVNVGSVDKGHSDSITLENMSSATPGDAAEKAKGDGEQGRPDLSRVSLDKAHAVDDRDDNLIRDTEMLEPGSVLVEFMRKEATCMAAHSLHLRIFGDRVVSVGYVPHDLYLVRYPR